MTDMTYSEGELCLSTVDAGCQALRNVAAKTTATSSPPVMSEDRRAVARLLDLLELESRARRLGRRDLANDYADRIVDEMLGGAA
jgi:hypothetical protein